MQWYNKRKFEQKGGGQLHHRSTTSRTEEQHLTNAAAEFSVKADQ
jgi:hypothetical protein